MVKCLDKTQNKLAIFLLKNNNFAEKTNKVIKRVQDNCKNICYVCLSKPYAEVIDNLKNQGINQDNFTFVDTVSSPHYKLQAIKNCYFVQGLENLKDIKKTIQKAVKKNECTAAIFDTISTLLIYQKTFDIVRFTHELITDEHQNKINKIFVILEEKGIYSEESKKLINDLNLFADKTFEIE